MFANPSRDATRRRTIAKLDHPLAIEGGVPTFPEGPPRWPVDDPEVAAALVAAEADGSWGQYHGPHTDALRDQLSQRHAGRSVRLCCSGTAAVELALRGLGVQPGDEVVLAAYDFPGNFRAVEAVGAIPVLVDVVPDSWCLDSAHLPSAITPATRAVLVSHLHGGLVDMLAIRKLADQFQIAVLEDACQAPGALVGTQMAGTWGDVSVLSFGGSKLLTAGRGGALLSARDDILQRIKIYADQGNDAYPLSELQAAVLRPQVDRLAQRNARRTAAVERLLQATAQAAVFQPLVNRVSGQAVYYKVAWHLAQSVVERPGRDAVLAAIQAEGIDVGAGFRGFAGRSDRRCQKTGTLTHSQQAGADTILLHHPVLLQSDETIDRLASVLNRVAHWLEQRC